MSRAVAIRLADPGEPAIRALLEAYWRVIAELFPPEMCFLLEVEAMKGPDKRFWAAEIGGAPVGCIALSLPAGADWAEVKSLYVDAGARGGGAADALLAALEAEARATGRVALMLETGDVLTAARRFYARHGFFERVEPFADYPANPRLVFMEKRLEPTG